MPIEPTPLNSALTAFRVGPNNSPEISDAASVATVVIDGRPEPRWTYHYLEEGDGLPWASECAVTGELNWSPTLDAARSATAHYDQVRPLTLPRPDAMRLRLATLLSILTGRWFMYDVEHLQGALEHLTRGPVFSPYQLSNATLAVRPHVVNRLPWLAELAPPPIEDGRNIVRAWLHATERERGRTHPVDPASAGTWAPGNVVADLVRAHGADAVPTVVIMP